MARPGHPASNGGERLVIVALVLGVICFLSFIFVSADAGRFRPINGVPDGNLIAFQTPAVPEQGYARRLDRATSGETNGPTVVRANGLP